MKKDNHNKAKHKYFAYGTSTGLLAGTTIAAIANTGIGSGAGL